MSQSLSRTCKLQRLMVCTMLECHSCVLAGALVDRCEYAWLFFVLQPVLLRSSSQFIEVLGDRLHKFVRKPNLLGNLSVSAAMLRCSAALNRSQLVGCCRPLVAHAPASPGLLPPWHLRASKTAEESRLDSYVRRLAANRSPGDGRMMLCGLLCCFLSSLLGRRHYEVLSFVGFQETGQRGLSQRE